MLRRNLVGVLLLISALTILSSFPFPAFFIGKQSAIEQAVVAQSLTGTARIIALNNPPSIINASLRIDISDREGKTNLTLRTLVNDPNSLVDIDHVVVHIFSQNETYAFKWVRRGSNSPPGNCRLASGCWYELQNSTWTSTYAHLDDALTHHDTVSNRITSGEWIFRITVPTPPDSSIGSCWGFQVDVADRSSATASNSGSLTCSNP
jgi:hypothetical protein